MPDGTSRYEITNGNCRNTNLRVPFGPLAQRSGASAIAATACSNSTENAMAARWLRVKYQLKAASYSAIASSWKTTSLLPILQLCGNAPLNFRPRNRLGLSGIQLRNTRGNFFVPSCLHALFLYRVQAFQQRRCELGALLIGKCQGQLQKVGRSTGHVASILRRR